MKHIIFIDTEVSDNSKLIDARYLSLQLFPNKPYHIGEYIDENMLSLETI